MSKRVDDVYLLDMPGYAQKVLLRLADSSREAFEADEQRWESVAYLLSLIGEAASKVSDDFRSENPDIEWTGIINLRHRLIHGYGNVDREKVWIAVSTGVPTLIASLKRLLGR